MANAHAISNNIIRNQKIIGSGDMHCSKREDIIISLSDTLRIYQEACKYEESRKDIIKYLEEYDTFKVGPFHTDSTEIHEPFVSNTTTCEIMKDDHESLVACEEKYLNKLGLIIQQSSYKTRDNYKKSYIKLAKLILQIDDDINILKSPDEDFCKTEKSVQYYFVLVFISYYRKGINTEYYFIKNPAYFECLLSCSVYDNDKILLEESDISTDKDYCDLFYFIAIPRD